MKIEDQFLKLYETACNGKDKIMISLEELQSIFECTRQNVRYLLRKMQEQHWLSWEPGKGRGHLSTLTFLISKDAFLLENSKRKLESGNITQAFHRISETRPETQQTFLKEIQQYFGYQIKNEMNEETELLRLSMGSPFRSLDPAALFFGKEFNIVKEIFNTLVTLDKENRVIPSLVYGWEHSEDGKAWTFYLRKHVLFHHGREMTADDVMFTFKRILGSAYSWILIGLDKIEKVKKHIIKVYFKKSNYLFIRLLASPPMSILPEDVYGAASGNQPALPIGTGPFQVVKNNPKTFQLDSFAGHFQGAPMLDRIEVWIVPEIGLPYPEKENKEQNSPSSLESQWKRLQFGQGFTQYLSLNTYKKGICQSPLFRQAVYSIIRRSMRMKYMDGRLMEPAYGFVCQTYTPKEISMKQISGVLDRAGYKGEPITLYTFKRSTNQKDAEWLQTSLAAAGIKIDIHYYPMEELLRKEKILEADIILKGDLEHEDSFFSLLHPFITSNSMILLHLNNEQKETFENFIIKLAGMKEALEQRDYLHEIEKTMLEQYQTIFLYRENSELNYAPSSFGIPKVGKKYLNFSEIGFPQK